MQEILERINEFLASIGIEDELIRSLIGNFITKHTELYGNIVSFEDLISRLNINLNQIIWHDPSERPNEYGFKNMVGQYVGFNDNSIHMYFSKSSLNNSQLFDDFKSIFFHELTHCAYTIKNNDIYETETQVFCTMEQQLNGKVDVVNGTEIFMEPIVNYISTTIDGKKNSAYISQTLSIFRLTNIIGQDKLISSAFHSDEEKFKSCFEIFRNDGYQYFIQGLTSFNNGRYNDGKNIMDNFFQNNIPNVTINQREIQELRTLKSSIVELKYQKVPEQSNNNYNKCLKKNGFVQVITLSFIVAIVEIAIFLLTYLAIIRF